MVNEKSNEIIVNIKIKDYTFTRQRETIITWKNEDSKSAENDNALSFQDNKAVSELCDTISILYGCEKVQEIDSLETLLEVDITNLPCIVKCLTNEPSPEITQRIIEKVTASDFFERLFKVLLDEETRIKDKENETVQVKAITTTNVTDYISETTQATVTKNAQEKKLKILENNMNFSKGIDKTERLSCISNNIYNVKPNKDNDLENQEDSTEYINLKLIFIIYKSLLSLGNQVVIETMLNENNYMGTFAALECKIINIYIYITYI